MLCSGVVMKKILSFIIFTIGSSLFALPFNKNLPEKDLKKLEEGEVVIRSIDKYNNMSIESDNSGVIKLREKVRKLGPNYLAEVIQIKPYKGNEDLPEKLYKALSNIPDYKGIPYWSERHQTYFDLYDEAEIIQRIGEGTSVEKILAKLNMEPFGEIYAPIVIEKNSDYILYVSTNNNGMKFKGVTCVKKGNMQSDIILFRDGDNWVLYGVGGVNAIKVWFLQDRIETSFIGRIKSFCNFFFTKF